MTVSSDAIEIYRTSKGCVYQSDREKKFYLEFGGTVTSFTVLSFFNFRKKVAKINLADMAQNTGKAWDFAIIAPSETERVYILTLCEVVQLKELLAGATVMLELNSILHERLYSVPV